jgi:hypothetical protein
MKKIEKASAQKFRPHLIENSMTSTGSWFMSSIFLRSILSLGPATGEFSSESRRHDR